MRSVYEKNLQSRHCETVTDKYRDRDIVEKPKAINLMQRWMVLKFKFSEQYIFCNDAYFDLEITLSPKSLRTKVSFGCITRGRFK